MDTLFDLEREDDVTFCMPSKALWWGRTHSHSQRRGNEHLKVEYQIWIEEYIRRIGVSTNFHIILYSTISGVKCVSCRTKISEKCATLHQNYDRG